MERKKTSHSFFGIVSNPSNCLKCGSLKCTTSYYFYEDIHSFLDYKNEPDSYLLSISDAVVLNCSSCKYEGKVVREGLDMEKLEVKGIPEINVSDVYGGYNIYSGRFSNLKGITIWTQAGDDLEGNPNENPAANIFVYMDIIRLVDGNGMERKWNVPKYKHELMQIQKEIDEELEKYYSQYTRRQMFIKKPVKKAVR